MGFVWGKKKTHNDSKNQVLFCIETDRRFVLLPNMFWWKDSNLDTGGN